MSKKEWTILIYANGNNELEPEMWRSKINLESNCKAENINVIIQISRAKKSIVNIIRSIDSDYEEEESWTGTRRYLVKDNRAILLEDMGEVNMANHKTLNKFIEWGSNKYLANKYMLIISGHGFLVATLSDICGLHPYTMGIYEMCNAINSINKNIDLLILDICNMNTVEVMYELGKSYKNTVRKLLTYIDSGPLNGMPYEKIINIIDNYPKNNLNELIVKIIDDMDLEAIAMEINHKKLNKIKYYLNRVGYLKLIKNNDSTSSNDERERADLKVLSKEILSTIIYYNSFEKGIFPIKIITAEMYDIENIDLFLKYYNKLAITKNNYWANVVANKTINHKLNMQISKCQQNILTRENILAFIALFNENEDDKAHLARLKKLYQYCNWI